jgi:hypothetical protein
MNDTELDEMLNLVVAPTPPQSLRRGLVAALPVPRRKIFGVPRRWAAPIAAAALCGLVGAAVFEIGPVQGQFYGSVESPAGPLYGETTRLVDPPVANLKWWFLGSGFSFGGTVAALHGSADMHNRFTKTFAGYQYTMDQTGEGLYRVTFSPLKAGAMERLMQPFKMNGQLIPTPSLPEPRIVQIGEPFEVTLYQSGGERIYDRIVVSWAAPQRARGSQPAPVATLRLTGAQLYVNGQLALTRAGAGAGPVIWVHLPGQGRVLAALDPQHNPLFVQGGHVNGSVMEFQSGGIQFRIVSQQPITTGGDRPIFVYHQQSFEEALNPANPLSQQPMLGNAGPASLHVQ